jgi:hypothetical protein
VSYRSNQNGKRLAFRVNLANALVAFSSNRDRSFLLWLIIAACYVAKCDYVACCWSDAA